MSSAQGSLRGSGEAVTQTFLFADLAGYTALTEAHGDEHAADTAERFCGLVRALLPAHEAEELNLVGDALLLRVPTASAAARLAAQIVSDHGHHNGLGVRVGMHTGSAVQRGHDWFGAAINLAARVADVAAAGEVLLTQKTRDVLPAATPTQPRGRRVFKNVSRAVELHELVVRPGQQEPRLTTDPVCRMAVDPALAAASQTHQGIEHHFCSAGCHELFDASPYSYAWAAAGPGGAPGHYVPAAGRAGLTAGYDLAMALTMRERRWRPALLHAATRDLPPGGTVLELGCGTGANAIALAQLRPDATVLAVDGDPSALAIAQRKAGAERVAWHHQLATEPVPGSSPIDVALCSLLLHHLSDADKRQVLTRLADALRGEGTVHIADWGPPRGLLTRLGAHALQALDGRQGPASLLAGELPTLLTDAGFSHSQCAGSVTTAWGRLQLWQAQAQGPEARSRPPMAGSHDPTSPTSEGAQP